MEGKDWKSEMEIDFSVYSGKAVYPPFREEVHVAKSQLVPIPGIPILRGWDAGLTPACSFSQLIPGRYNIFEGLHTTGREGVGITRFGQEVVEYSNVMFPGFKFQDYGDPALLQRSQVDERTCAQVLATMGIAIIPGMVGSKARDDVMRVQFERMVDGRPFVQVCPTAVFMIEGFKGAFQYKRIGQTEMFLSDHEKNDCSHVQESLQYVASRIFQVGDPQGRNAGKKKNSKSVMGRRPDPRR